MLVVAAVVLGACAGGASTDAEHESTTSVSSSPVASTTAPSSATDDTPKPGFIPGAAGDGIDGEVIAEQLEPPPVSPEFCRTADVEAVAALIGGAALQTIGFLDPSQRVLCQFVDAAETTLVRARLTAAEQGAAAAFAELVGDPVAETIDETTVLVGRRVAHLDGSLIEVTVTEDAILDEAAAGTAAVAVLAALQTSP